MNLKKNVYFYIIKVKVKILLSLTLFFYKLILAFFYFINKKKCKIIKIIIHKKKITNRY